MKVRWNKIIYIKNVLKVDDEMIQKFERIILLRTQEGINNDRKLLQLNFKVGTN